MRWRRDCLIAHGASMVIKDRLLDESDGIEMYVCAQSGHIAWHDPQRNTYVSPIHGDGAEVYKVQTSYAFKLLLDEMKSLGVAAVLNWRTKNEPKKHDDSQANRSDSIWTDGPCRNPQDVCG